MYCLHLPPLNMLKYPTTTSVRVPQVLRIVNAVRLPLLDSRLLVPPGLETASMPL